MIYGNTEGLSTLPEKEAKGKYKSVLLGKNLIELNLSPHRFNIFALILTRIVLEMRNQLKQLIIKNRSI